MAGRLIFRASVPGAGRTARKWDRAALQLDQDIRSTVYELGHAEEQLFQAAAPEDTGRLRGGIHVRPAGGLGSVAVEIEAEARDPESGYDYVGVTRRGHRVAVITPHPPKRALYFRRSNTWPRLMVRSVRGYHPATDWVENVMPAARAAASEASRRLGRRVRTRLL